jgi:hypothetical protein
VKRRHVTCKILCSKRLYLSFSKKISEQFCMLMFTPAIPVALLLEVNSKASIKFKVLWEVAPWWWRQYAPPKRR